MKVTEDDRARAQILAGFAVCARLLVAGRTDLIVRLAADFPFAARVSRLVLTAIRHPESSNLGEVVKAIEQAANAVDTTDAN